MIKLIIKKGKGENINIIRGIEKFITNITNIFNITNMFTFLMMIIIMMKKVSLERTHLLQRKSVPDDIIL